MDQIRELDVRMARQNRQWGDTGIRDALWNLGHDVGRTTIANILKEHGIEPAPARRVQVTGTTTSPNDRWMMQVGRNLTEPIDGFVANERFLILDRDTKYSKQLDRLLEDTGIEVIRLPRRASNLNAYAERFVRSIKEECLGGMIFFGERSLRRATREYAAHYHEERNHQGIGNRRIEPKASDPGAMGRVRCSERLGGMLRFYHRTAA